MGNKAKNSTPYKVNKTGHMWAGALTTFGHVIGCKIYKLLILTFPYEIERTV